MSFELNKSDVETFVVFYFIFFKKENWIFLWTEKN